MLTDLELSSSAATSPMDGCGFNASKSLTIKTPGFGHRDCVATGTVEHTLTGSSFDAFGLRPEEISFSRGYPNRLMVSQGTRCLSIAGRLMSVTGHLEWEICMTDGDMYRESRLDLSQSFVFRKENGINKIWSHISEHGRTLSKYILPLSTLRVRNLFSSSSRRTYVSTFSLCLRFRSSSKTRNLQLTFECVGSISTAVQMKLPRTRGAGVPWLS